MLRTLCLFRYSLATTILASFPVNSSTSWFYWSSSQVYRCFQIGVGWKDALSESMVATFRVVILSEGIHYEGR